MGDTQRLLVRTLVDLTPFLQAGPGPQARGVHASGVILTAKAETEEPLGLNPKSRLHDPARYRVHRWKDGEVQSLVTGEEAAVFHYVQPTRDGVLLVGARCQKLSEGPELNAVEYTWDGCVLRRFCLGDGIEDVRTTSDGSIWVTYFDEGVLGTRAWSDPMGAPGCVRYDSEGQPEIKYDPFAADTERILDVYAFNTQTSDDVWLVSRPGFRIVRLRRGQYQAWSSSLRGVRALAIDRRRALCFGTYEEPDVAHIVELQDGGRVSEPSRLELVDEDGGTIQVQQAFGVGRRLYLFDDSRCCLLEDW